MCGCAACLPALYSGKDGAGGQPHAATLTSAAVVCVLNLIPIAFDGLDTVLALTSMFYLQCYAITNLACFAQLLAATPNFRPTFRFFSKRSALVGFIASLGSMFYIDLSLAALSWLLYCILFGSIHATTPPQHWGEVTQALLFHQTRELLLKLDDSSVSPPPALLTPTTSSCWSWAVCQLPGCAWLPYRRCGTYGIGAHSCCYCLPIRLAQVAAAVVGADWPSRVVSTR